MLLESRSKPLLKSQKILNLRSGPYTVIEKIMEVAYGIQNHFTNEKKIVHRNHIVEYFPKEQQMPKLLQEYSNDLVSGDFYDHKTNQQILDLFEVQLPILLKKPLILLLVTLVVMASAAYLAAVLQRKCKYKTRAQMHIHSNVSESISAYKVEPKCKCI